VQLTGGGGGGAASVQCKIVVGGRDYDPKPDRLHIRRAPPARQRGRVRPARTCEVRAEDRVL